MALSKSLPLLVFALATIPLWARGADAPTPPHIPPLHGTTFAGTEVTLPQAFSGKVGILVVGFTRASQVSARSWGTRLAERYPAGSRVVYYEMPVLADVPGWLRGWVLGRIRQSVGASARDHFLPVLDHAAEWKRAAGDTSPDSAVILVVDDQGVVRWRNQGAAGDSVFQQMEQQVSLLAR